MGIDINNNSKKAQRILVRIGGASMSILIVDDTTIMRNVLKMFLHGLGFNDFIEADNGSTAIMKYVASYPDLVIMDLNMPNSNGLEVLKKIKHIDSEAKIIICSASGSSKVIKTAMALGAIDYIIKPVDKDRLKEALWRNTLL